MQRMLTQQYYSHIISYRHSKSISISFYTDDFTDGLLQDPYLDCIFAYLNMLSLYIWNPYLNNIIDIPNLESIQRFAV